MQRLVTVDWLADRLTRPGAIVLDATLPPVGVTPPVDTRARYIERHIPRAVFFDIDELSDHSTTLPHMLPASESFARSMEQLGVGHEMTIVVYEQGDVFSAPRARWMLRAMGARDVHVLDGGLKAWIAAGLPTESGEVQRPAATFRAHFDEREVRRFDDVQGIIAEHGQILDARSAGRFTGAAPEPRPGISSGHMPGAISLPYTELLQDGRFKSAEELAETFRSRGVQLDKPVTTTCGSGVTAAVLLFALELAGAPQVSLYDGSWAEYAQRPEAAIEKES